jgi:hypothetical protein
MKKLFVLMVICFICLSGCASVPIRRHSQFDNYFSTGEKTVTLMPIDIKFYKLTAGGMSEQMDEWDADSDELFKAALMERLDISPKIRISIFDEGKINNDQKKFLETQNGLYRAVAQSIILHTYTPGCLFPNKISSFDYTLGRDLSQVNDFMHTDALLFLSGSRTYWTGGRVFLACWGVLLSSVSGVAVLPASVPDWVAASLVDAKTGNVIWFRYVGLPGNQIGDLRNERVVENTVDYLFKDLKE